MLDAVTEARGGHLEKPEEEAMDSPRKCGWFHRGPDIPKLSLRVSGSSHVRARWGALGKSILVTSQGGGESGDFLKFCFFFQLQFTYNITETCGIFHGALGGLICFPALL